MWRKRKDGEGINSPEMKSRGGEMTPVFTKDSDKHKKAKHGLVVVLMPCLCISVLHIGLSLEHCHFDIYSYLYSNCVTVCSMLYENS